MSNFNAEAFMNATFSEAHDIILAPCPAGEFVAQVASITPADGIIGKGDNIGKPWARLDVAYEIQDESVRQQLGRSKVTVRQGIMLDLTDAGGINMAKGSNIGLGRFREACGINQAGFSLAQAVGRTVKVSVKHVPSFRDPSIIVAEVTGVAALA